MSARTGRRAAWPSATLAVLLAIAGIALVVSMANEVSAQRDHRVIVLGIDGMDHRLLSEFMEAGHLPNFSRLG